MAQKLTMFDFLLYSKIQVMKKGGGWSFVKLFSKEGKKEHLFDPFQKEKASVGKSEKTREKPLHFFGR